VLGLYNSGVTCVTGVGGSGTFEVGFAGAAGFFSPHILPPWAQLKPYGNNARLFLRPGKPNLDP
jgi:hypothetical protein